MMKLASAFGANCSMDQVYIANIDNINALLTKTKTMVIAMTNTYYPPPHPPVHWEGQAGLIGTWRYVQP